VISAFRSLRQEDFKFEANLGYVARSASIKKKKKKKERKKLKFPVQHTHLTWRGKSKNVEFNACTPKPHSPILGLPWLNRNLLTDTSSGFGQTWL
jgi:hypothetical protein